MIRLLRSRCRPAPEARHVARGSPALWNRRQSRVGIRIGVRYFFQPRMCMPQWCHSGLVNYMNRVPCGLQIRLEGLWIG